MANGSQSGPLGMILKVQLKKHQSLLRQKANEALGYSFKSIYGAVFLGCIGFYPGWGYSGGMPKMRLHLMKHVWIQRFLLVSMRQMAN